MLGTYRGSIWSGRSWVSLQKQHNNNSKSQLAAEKQTQKQFPNEGATQTHSVRTDCHALAHRACAVSDILLVLMHPTVSCQHYSSRQWRNGRACRGLTSPSIVDVKGGILFTLSFVVWMMVRNQ